MACTMTAAECINIFTIVYLIICVKFFDVFNTIHLMYVLNENLKLRITTVFDSMQKWQLKFQREFFKVYY